jgi:hypothetical protein
MGSQIKAEGGLRAQREQYFNDVKAQMVAESIAQEYNKRKPSKKVLSKGKASAQRIEGLPPN